MQMSKSKPIVKYMELNHVAVQSTALFIHRDILSVFIGAMEGRGEWPGWGPGIALALPRQGLGPVGSQVLMMSAVSGHTQLALATRGGALMWMKVDRGRNDLCWRVLAPSCQGGVNKLGTRNPCQKQRTSPTLRCPLGPSILATSTVV